MGGKAAKERRRLERLEKQGDAGRASQEAKEMKNAAFKKKEPHAWRNGGESPRPPFNNTKTAGASTIRSKVVPKGKNHTKAKFVAKKTMVEPKKTFKKPKHLKRKLEHTEDEVAKEKVLSELQKLEERKKLFSKNQPSKKQKIGKGSDSNPKQVTPTAPHRPIMKDDKKKLDENPRQTLTDETNLMTTASPRLEAKHESNTTLKTTKKPVKPRVSKSSDEPTLMAEPIAVEHTVAEKPSQSTTSPSKPATTLKTATKQESIEVKTLTHIAKDATVKIAGTKKPDDDSDDSDGSDDDGDEPVNKRQRGRRRKGLLDTDKRTQEANQIGETSGELNATDSKEVSKPFGKTRRCIGRKPVTDFIVGQRYPGKVVYIKPFGVFIDINCHSEVFCHVSRVQDDFVETPEDVLKVGDDVNPRVVEIDREKKRITVSLQSDQRTADEKASADAHVERSSKRRRNRSKTKSDDHDNAESPQPKEESIETEPDGALPTNNLVDAQGKFLKEESEMTPAELKRARKLERRAQRRTQQLD